MSDAAYRTHLIEDHGVIGNMRSAAMVALDGTIDFFCFPHFDSPTIFAALLDQDKGGYFSIVPGMAEVRYKQMYLPDTNILLTRFLSEEGVVELTDFMPVAEGEPDSAYAHQVLRMVRVIKGEVSFQLRCAPRFDYARAGHEACKEQHAICFHPENSDLPSMALHATVPLAFDDQDAVASFTLKSQECAYFAFGSVKKEEQTEHELLAPQSIEECFTTSSKYWRDWIEGSVYKGRWREMVNRSALALKLLSSQKDGSLLAAATFGLPENPGGSRNWDYRYTWLRDASFALYALVRLGLSTEVKSYTLWLGQRLMDGLAAEAEDGPLRIMYRADGSDHLQETELDHLSGYKNSRPVRIGNSAVDQLQLDIYGDVLDAVYLSNKYSSGMSKDGWRKLLRVMDWLADNWERPDEGIWEMRGGRKHLLHSRLMCWVAFDRVIRLASKRSFDAPLEKWRDNRRRINDDILDNFWSDEHQSFVRAKGETEVDASMLLMPMMRFISPVDPRWLSTMQRIEETLTEDSLVFRYPSGIDGLDGTEGSFTACSFWLIECLARADQIDKARLLFDKMLGYANHVGLYSEQLGSNGEQLGNFPQALTHLALISAASMLDRKLNGTKETWG